MVAPAVAEAGEEDEVDVVDSGVKEETPFPDGLFK